MVVVLSENLHAVVTVIHPQKIRRDEPMIFCLLCESLWVVYGSRQRECRVLLWKEATKYTLFSVSKLEMELT